MVFDKNTVLTSFQLLYTHRTSSTGNIAIPDTQGVQNETTHLVRGEQ